MKIHADQCLNERLLKLFRELISIDLFYYFIFCSLYQGLNFGWPQNHYITGNRFDQERN